MIAGQVDREIAANASTNRHDFLVALERALKQQAHDDRAAAEPPPHPVGGPLRGADVQVGETIPELRVAHSEPT